MAQYLLGLSGTKQSGKTTCVNYLHGTILQKQEVIKDFAISKQGKLLIPTEYMDANKQIQRGMGEVDWQNTTYEFEKFCQDNVFPHVREFSFADPLKHMCMDLLGLTWEQCYGTDDQKNSLTNIKWEDIPGNVVIGEDDYGYALLEPERTGYMTAREVLQVFGTDIFRRVYENVWVDNGIKRFFQSNATFGIFSDIRFPNELDAVWKSGGKVIRFLRRPHTDLHKSETALDHLNDESFHAVIDNRKMNIPEQNEAVYNLLLEWGWI